MQRPADSRSNVVPPAFGANREQPSLVGRAAHGVVHRTRRGRVGDDAQRRARTSASRSSSISTLELPVDRHERQPRIARLLEAFDEERPVARLRSARACRSSCARRAPRWSAGSVRRRAAAIWAQSRRMTFGRGSASSRSTGGRAEGWSCSNAHDSCTASSVDRTHRAACRTGRRGCRRAPAGPAGRAWSTFSRCAARAPDSRRRPIDRPRAARPGSGSRRHDTRPRLQCGLVTIFRWGRTTAGSPPSVSRCAG